MKEKLRRLERDFQDLSEDQKNYVTLKHFDAVLDPLKTAINIIQKDIKEILRAVSDRSTRTHL